MLLWDACPGNDWITWPNQACGLKNPITFACQVEVLLMTAPKGRRWTESLVEALDLDEEGPEVFYRVGHGSQGTHSDVKRDNGDPGAEGNAYFGWQWFVRAGTGHLIIPSYGLMSCRLREGRTDSEITVVGQHRVASFSISTGLNFVQGSTSLYRAHTLLSHEQFHPIGKRILSRPNWSKVSVVSAMHFTVIKHWH